MAKTIKGARLILEVDDNNTLKVIGQEAAAAGKALGGVGKSAGDTRRNLQAMSGRVESGTKGFARMQQGTGGLVQAYAILASTIFAVTAAFRALENAQNIQNQIRGFKELTAVTGTSMLSITSSVRAATGGLLDFQTAAQQTAIATAAGFSKNQIVELAAGARNASVALGRDLTDSFNRLVRGVTKAEPELLDELGVILRLDIATRKFAAANGLSAEKLTIAQRRMAVFNEVSEQLNNNFGDINAKAMELLNPFTRFGTMISDIGIQVGGFFTTVLNPLIGFLERNSVILGVLLAAVAKGLIGQMIPSLANVSQALTNFAENGKNKLRELNNAQKANQDKLDKINAKFKIGETRKNQFFRDGLKKRGISEKQFLEMSGKQQLKLTQTMIKEERRRIEVSKKGNKKRLAAFIAVEKRIQQEVNKTSTTMVTKMSLASNKVERSIIRLGIVGRTALAGIGTAAASLAPIFSALGAVMNLAFGVIFALMTVTFFVDLIPAVKKAKDALKGLREAAKESEKAFVLSGIAVKSFADVQLKRVSEAMDDIEKRARATNKAVKFLSNTLQNLGGDAGDGIKAIEKGIANAMGEFGRADLSGTASKGTNYQSNQAKAAGKVYMTNFLNEAIALAEQNSPLVEETLARMFTPTEITEKHGRREANEVSIGYKTDESSLEIGAKRAKAVMKALAEIDGSRPIREQEAAFRNLLAVIDDFEIDYRSLLTVQQIGNERFITTNASARKFFNTMEAGNRETKLQVIGLSNLEIALKDLNESMDLTQGKPTALGKLGGELAKVFNEIEKVDKDSVVKFNKEDLNLYEAAVQALADSLGIDRARAKILFDNKQTLLDTVELVDKILQKSKANSMVQSAELKLMGQLNDRHTKREIILQKIANLEEDIQVKHAEQLIAQTDFRKEQELQEQINQNNVDLLSAQKFEMEAQLEILKNQVDQFFQIRKAVIETFDKAGQTALTDILVGGDEKDAIRKMAESIQKSAAGGLADMIMTPITGKVKDLFNMGKDDTVKLTPEAKAIKLAHDHHLNKLQLILQAHVKAFGGEMSLLKDVGRVTHMEKQEDGTYKEVVDEKGATNTLDSIFGGSEDGSGGGFLSKLFGKKADEEGEGGSPGFFGTSGGTDLFNIKAAFNDIFGENGAFMQTGKNLFGGKDSVFGKLGNSLFGEGGAFSKMFGGGEGGFMGGLGQMFGAGGKGIGGMLGGLFGGGGGGGLMGLLKPLLSMIPGIGPLLSILPFAKGGIIGNKLVALAKGGVMERYAKGGIATQPTYLVGEGKQNEAVVPLPDNKSIPVDLGRGAGSENNVSISVNMADGSTSTKSDAEQGKQLGAAINAAVLAELEKQQRPGGMLQRG